MLQNCYVFIEQFLQLIRLIIKDFHPNLPKNPEGKGEIKCYKNMIF